MELQRTRAELPAARQALIAADSAQAVADRRNDAVAAKLEAPIGDRPDELAGTSLRPDELGQRLDASGRITRHSEKLFRRLAIGIREQHRPALGIAQQHPVLHRQIVPPQPHGINQYQLVDRSRRCCRDFRGNQATE